MALAIPFWYNLSQRISWIHLCVITFSLIFIQPMIISAINLIEWKILRYALNETLPYLIGYSAIALPAFRIKTLTSKQIIATLGVLLCSIIIMLAINGLVSPQHFKYPPQSLYILYGLFCSIGLWSLKPVIGKLTFISGCGVSYLSSNSMWIYLWHIIPVYIVAHCYSYFNSWPVRYIFVLTVALILTATYNYLTTKLYTPKSK